jgi:UDP-2,3-diacylglucosamine hydrolase
MTGKYYFASDFHLGVNGRLSSADREKQIVRWLESIRHDASEIFLVGDIFDYWFEYRQVIPKGFSRLIGKLGELRDQGIPISFFTGNHDMWMFTYFQDELGIPIHRSPIHRIIEGKSFYIGHGDGLGPGDQGYKFIKKVFSNKLCQWAFARIHPNLGVSIMKYWSGKSRDSQREDKRFLGKDKEWLIQFAEETIKSNEIDYFVFGHRHLPIDYDLSNDKSRYINLGDWLEFNSYGVFDGTTMELAFFETEKRVFPGENLV